MESLKDAGDNSHLWAPLAVPGKGPGKEMCPPPLGSLGEQQPLLGSLGEAKPPGSVPKVSPLPAGPWSASSLSPHPAGPLRPGPPDYSNNTTAFHTANPDFLPVGITQRQGLAPAQTTCSAVVTLGMG